MLNNLSVEQTLHCFGKYYREEVLNDPDGESHQNIRQFIKNGYTGISFEREVLYAEKINKELISSPVIFIPLNQQHNRKTKPTGNYNHLDVR